MATILFIQSPFSSFSLFFFSSNGLSVKNISSWWMQFNRIYNINCFSCKKNADDQTWGLQYAVNCGESSLFQLHLLCYCSFVRMILSCPLYPLCSIQWIWWFIIVLTIFTMTIILMQSWFCFIHYVESIRPTRSIFLFSTTKNETSLGYKKKGIYLYITMFGFPLYE